MPAGKLLCNLFSVLWWFIWPWQWISPLGLTKKIDRIRRRFLWREDKKLMVDIVWWPGIKSDNPLSELGGLGIANLRRMGWALRMRCCGWKKLYPIDLGAPFWYKSIPMLAPSPRQSALQLVTVPRFSGRKSFNLWWIFDDVYENHHKQTRSITIISFHHRFANSPYGL